MPAAIIYIIDTDDNMPTQLHMYLFVLAHLNSALNPILYAAFNPKIKQSYKHFVNFISCGFLCSSKNGEKDFSQSETQTQQTVKHGASLTGKLSC